LESLKGRDYLEDLGVNRGIIIWLEWQDSDWILLIHDRGQWQALVNAVKNLQDNYPPWS
jgi:hypothetical protein